MANTFIQLPVKGAIESINGLTGAIVLAAGSNVTVNDDGVVTITIAATGGGGNAYFPGGW